MSSRIVERAQSGNLVYIFPEEVVRENYMMLTVIEKVREDGTKASIKQSGRFFILPIPSNLTVASKMDYEQKNIGALGALSAGMIKGGAGGEALTDIGGALQSKIESGLSLFGDETTMTDAEMDEANRSKDQMIAGITSAVATLAGKKFGGGLGAAIAGATTGGDVLAGVSLAERVALNPHLAVLFKGVGLRSFSFQYKFIARSQDESNKLRDIVKALKYHMHPEYFVGGFAFKYPDEFELTFSTNRRDWLFDIKSCVLTDMSVNYNGENMPIFFEDVGGPVSIDITMNFQETKIFTKEDYQI